MPQANQKLTPEEEALNAADHVTEQLAAMEKFIARRFDEISMEINATSQQVDMAEEGMTRRFSEILEIMHAISHSGGGLTQANTGVELDAVVEVTEEAANKILDAADRISTRIQNSRAEKDETTRKKILEGIDEDIQEIFMACSFQDITGQRIRKTLENLKMIEERLGSALNKAGIELPSDAGVSEDLTRKAQSQDDIDALFSEGRGESSQAE